MTLKIALLAPIPRPRVRITTRVKPGDLKSMRNAKRTSCFSSAIADLAYETVANGVRLAEIDRILCSSYFRSSGGAALIIDDRTDEPLDEKKTPGRAAISVAFSYPRRRRGSESRDTGFEELRISPHEEIPKGTERDFVPTESGLTYSSSNQRSDSDVIRVVGRMR